MRGIDIIAIVFMILFLIERKSINILINYIGITIAIAMIIGNTPEIQAIEGEYLAYILILVQVSALTILFGFLIMLYPEKTETISYKYIRYIIIISIIIISIGISHNSDITFYLLDIKHEILREDAGLLRHLGDMLYLDNNTIIKLIAITILLFIAIIGLFFLLS